MRRKLRTFGIVLLFLGLPLAVGGLASGLTAFGMPRYEALEKPFFTPPSLLFPMVWTLLYLLMGIGGARVWLSGRPQRQRAMWAFGLQLVVNFLWTVWFFGAGLYLPAFFWALLLLAAVGWMMEAFFQADPVAGRLQIPCLLWTGFAAVLNFAVFFLNQ